MSTAPPAAPSVPAGVVAPAFEMRGITKTFPGVTALEDVSFACRAGEIHTLCGENGAGKSTLMKILGGIHRADRGDVRVDGRPVAFTHPAAARDAGISVIHQEFSLLPDRTVADNLFLGREPSRWGVVDRGAMRRRTRALLDRLFAEGLSPDARVGDLPVAQQQVVEIAKAIAFDARIVVMDEPTAALEEHEVAAFKRIVRRLREQGVAVVYISHRMAEVFELADTITVLKDGRHVLTAPRADLDIHAVVKAMVGRELGDFFPARAAAPGEPVLVLEGGSNDQLRDVSLTVRRGEIVGVVGLEGSGKAALGRALFGVDPFTMAQMHVAGRAVVPTSARAAIAAGLGYLPDDRKAEGLALMQSVRDNGMLTLRALAGPWGPPNAAAARPQALDRLMAEVDVRAASPDQEVRLLSGGNQQKAIVARWFACDPEVLIFAEPTRGIDVNTKATIYRLMRRYAEAGKGVVMISSDLPEVIGVSDRIVVMRGGRIAGERPGGVTEEEIMALATGHSAPVGEAAR